MIDRTKDIIIIRSMGYRKSKEDDMVFSKPFGHSMFSINLDQNKIYNFFKAINGAIHIMDSKVLWNDNLLRSIKEFEAYAKVMGLESNFEFISMEEVANEIL